MRRRIACGIAGAALLFAGACRQSPKPVAELDVRPAQLRLGWPDFTEIEIRIRPTRELPAGVERPTVFVHLLDEPGSVLRTFDHPLPADWRLGKEIDYRERIFESALADPLPAGTYLLSIGLYDPDAGRFALATKAERIAREEYKVATVEVTAPAAGGPQARFSEQWLQPEVGADRQVIVSRRLEGGTVGTIQFGPLVGPGSILVGLQVPTDVGPGTRLELAEGETQPKVKLQSSCRAESAEVSGVGRFDVEMQVAAASAPVTCEISVEPNFQLSTSERSDTVSVRLALLAWRAGTGGDTGD